MLMNYDYDVKYIPGLDIPHVDALSRLRFKKEDPNADERRTVAALAVNSVSFAVPLLQISVVRNEIKRDATLQRILWRVVSGDWSDCSQMEKPFKCVSERLTVNDGVLYNRSRLFIPAKLRAAAFSICHNDVHCGVHSTHRRMQASSWWPNMLKDVNYLISVCSVCSKIRPRSDKSIHCWPSALPFQRVHMDWAYTKEVGEVLVIVDSGSGWIEAFRCKDRSSSSVIACLEVVFTRFGPPETVVSDNAKEFVSSELNCWIQAQGATKTESPPYFPQSNGRAERAVQTVKRFMKCWATSQSHQDFPSYLRKVLFHHRISSNMKGLSPAEIVFGRKVRAPIASAYQQGQKVYYKANIATPTADAEYLMTKGNNTSWIIKQNGSEDERAVLVSNNQLSPAKDRDVVVDAIGNDAMDDGTTIEQVVQPLGGELRRSTRERKRPDFYGIAH